MQYHKSNIKREIIDDPRPLLCSTTTGVALQNPERRYCVQHFLDIQKGLVRVFTNIFIVDIIDFPLILEIAAKFAAKAFSTRAGRGRGA
jgi:hypothetical protein